MRSRQEARGKRPEEGCDRSGRYDTKVAGGIMSRLPTRALGYLDCVGAVGWDGVSRLFAREGW